MKTTIICLFLVSIIFTDVYCQGTRVNIEFRNGLETKIPGDRSVVETRSKDVNGRAEYTNERPEAKRPVPNQIIPNPPIPLVRPVISYETRESLRNIRRVTRSIVAIKSLLVGSNLLGLVTDNAEESLASIFLSINNKDWVSMEAASHNLSQIQKNLISNIAENTIVVIGEKLRVGNNTDYANLNAEINFWEQLQNHMNKRSVLDKDLPNYDDY